MKKTAPRSPQAVALLEKHIEAAVCDLLALDGWRVFKMEQNFSERKRKTIGEPGLPDRLAVRYMGDGFASGSATVQLIWLEIKRGKFGKLSQAQKFWHAAERQRGALVWVVVSVNDFIDQYHASGLMRKAFLAKARTA